MDEERKKIIIKKKRLIFIGECEGCGADVMSNNKKLCRECGALLCSDCANFEGCPLCDMTM